MLIDRMHFFSLAKDLSLVLQNEKVYKLLRVTNHTFDNARSIARETIVFKKQLTIFQQHAALLFNILLSAHFGSIRMMHPEIFISLFRYVYLFCFKSVYEFHKSASMASILIVGPMCILTMASLPLWLQS